MQCRVLTSTLVFIAGKRTEWSTNDLNILRFSFKEFFRALKPPTYPAIAAVQSKYEQLAMRTKEQIKSRAWHLIQTNR